MRKTTSATFAALVAATLLAGCGESGGPGNTLALAPTSPTAPGGTPSTPPTMGGGGEQMPPPGVPPVGPKSCITNAFNYEEVGSLTQDKMTMGEFTVPFCEEKFLSDYPDEEIPDRAPATGGVSNPAPPTYSGLEHCKRRSEGKVYECKPTAGSIALLPDDRMVYFNALESTENVEFNIVKEFGDVAINDQTRVMKLNANGVATWTRPINNDGGAQSPTNDTGGGAGDPNAGISPDDPQRNDGALFCAHLVNMYDGRVLAAGGTDYYTEAGAVELEGLKNTRIFNPANDTWSQADLMTWGRWYPTLVTLANGNIFVVSGVRKLIKPVYPDRPVDESARNETHTEIFQPGCNDGNGKWTDNGEAGRKSLPLFARMHLIPNNQVVYTTGGQAFNPFGQSYDQALWNFQSAYDPATNTWTDLGIPGTPIPGGPPSIPAPPMGLPGLPAAPAIPGAPATPNVPIPGLPAGLPQPPFGIPGPGSLPLDLITNNLPIGSGFRGSTFNLLMPLVPNAEGKYTKAEFFTAGGTIGLSPGSPAPIANSRIDTIDLADDGTMTPSSREPGPLTKARWYGNGVLLPTGAVMVFSGADLDEVINPGTGTPIMETELFDPVTETWRVMGTQGKARTYHNTEFLMADGRIMVGGHGPISNNYSMNFELPGKSPQGRDPSFEIYSPPYIFKARPSITSVSAATVMPGSTLTINTPDAASVMADGYVVLVRRPAITHLVDGDQRNVVLRVLSSTANSITVQIPNNRAEDLQAVLPPGHYMLFVVNKASGELSPSKSAPVLVSGADLSCR